MVQKMTKIKICGIKTITDALAAMDAGADLIGFNFYPKSPRYIEVGGCRDIMSVMRKYDHMTYVGVFVNASAATIRTTTADMVSAGKTGRPSPGRWCPRIEPMK